VLSLNYLPPAVVITWPLTPPWMRISCVPLSHVATGITVFAVKFFWRQLYFLPSISRVPVFSLTPSCRNKLWTLIRLNEQQHLPPQSGSSTESAITAEMVLWPWCPWVTTKKYQPQSVIYLLYIFSLRFQKYLNHYSKSTMDYTYLQVELHVVYLQVELHVVYFAFIIFLGVRLFS
jgi:hypothetical protein